MTCAACSGIIEKETKLLKGVESAQVNFATETAEFQTTTEFDLETFHALLKKLGYRAIDPNARENKNSNSIFYGDFYKALIALVLASVTMFYAMVIPNNTIQTILTTILVFGFGRTYIKCRFILSLKHEYAHRHLECSVHIFIVFI